MSNNDDLLAIAARLADRAGAGEQIEAYVSRIRETSVRIYEGEVEHLSSAGSEGIGVRVVRDGRTGFAYAGTLEPSDVDDALAEARDNVAFGGRDEHAGLAEPDGVAVAPLELWREALTATPTERKIDLARELERLALAADLRVRVEDSTYGDVLAEEAVASSTGVRAVSRETACYSVVSVLAVADGETQTGWAYTVGRDLDDLDLPAAAAEATTKALRLLGSVKPRSRRVTVVLDPFVTAQVLGAIGSALSGENLLKGRSFFAGRVGEQVAAPSVSLIDDPTNPLAFTATAVDGEGLATRRNVLLADGVLQGFVHNSYSARRAGTSSTGNATRGGFKTTPGCGTIALALRPGTRPQDALIASVDDGVLIDQVQGFHSGVNPVSGDFSTGASGLVIRGGQLAEPIREFTIASTLQRMLLDVVEVGGDVRWLPMGAAGVSLVVGDVTMSGA